MKPELRIKDESFSSDYVWSQFKKGETWAFESIYKSHFSQLYRYGMTILPNESVIKDAIQQLFVDLWNYKSNLSDVETVSFYLMKSLRTKVYRIVKESNKLSYTDTFLDCQMEKLPSHETLVIAEQDELSKSRNLRVQVNNLPDRQREVVMLVFFESKSYEEVASLLSMTVQSVYTLLWRSVNSLRKSCKL